MSKKDYKPYKVLKSIVGNDEAKAEKNAEEKLETISRNLRPEHTEKVFVFHRIR